MAKPNFKSSGRDAWGNAHGGPGKGDKARHKSNQEWRNNYDAIAWEPKVKGKFHKVYGPRKVSIHLLPDDFPAFSGQKDR